MSSAFSPATAILDPHKAFDAALGRIDDAIRYSFRRWPGRLREEARAEALAYTWAAWHGLLARGKDPVAVGVVAIAANSCRAVKNGRALGAVRATGRGVMDALDPRALRRLKLRVLPIEEMASDPTGSWADWLGSRGRYGPADEASFRVDFASWLGNLPARKRRMAELLAEGLGTGEVARHLGVTPAAVSQARAWLGRSWGQFQGEDGDAS